MERSHRIDAEEFYRLLDGVVIDDAKSSTTSSRNGEDFYNYHRPHGGHGGQTPYERLSTEPRGSVSTSAADSWPSWGFATLGEWAGSYC